MHGMFAMLSIHSFKLKIDAVSGSVSQELMQKYDVKLNSYSSCIV